MYDKWSLDILYSGFDDPKFLSDVEKTDKFVKKFEDYAATLGTKDEKTTVTEILQLNEAYADHIHTLFNYCALRQNTDTTDSNCPSYLGQLMQKNNATTKPSTLMEKYIAGIEDLDALIADDSFLQEYSYYQIVQKNSNTCR